MIGVHDWEYSDQCRKRHESGRRLKVKAGDGVYLKVGGDMKAS